VLIVGGLHESELSCAADSVLIAGLQQDVLWVSGNVGVMWRVLHGPKAVQ